MNELQQILEILGSTGIVGGVLATLVKVEGSSYRRPGARMLLISDGRRTGSISGGCLEDDVIAHAHQVMATERPVEVTYDTTAENDLVWGVGLGCHGLVHVLIEKLPAHADLPGERGLGESARQTAVRQFRSTRCDWFDDVGHDTCCEL